MAQGGFGPPIDTGAPIDICPERKTPTACVNPQPTPFSCRWVNNACERFPEPDLHVCVMIDSSDSITSSEWTTLMNALSTDVARDQKDSWFGIVTYDSDVNVYRGVTPSSVGESPQTMFAHIPQKNPATSQSLAGEALAKCIELLESANVISNPLLQKLVTVAGRGPTDTNNLCDESPNSPVDVIIRDFIQVLNIRVGSDIAGGNLNDLQCLNQYNNPKGLVHEITDAQLATGSVSTPIFGAVNTQRRRLMNILKH